MVMHELKWVVEQKMVYNVDTGENEILNCLHINNICGYNSTMGQVDIADQLQGIYTIIRFI